MVTKTTYLALWLVIFRARTRSNRLLYDSENYVEMNENANVPYADNVVLTGFHVDVDGPEVPSFWM